MKIVVALCILAVVALADAKPQSRGCIYVMGRCHRECEEGTHAYAPGCGPKTPEPTCDELNPQPEEGTMCDFTACYCDAPTVRDTVSGKCVPIDQCPKKEEDKKVTPFGSQTTM